MVINIRVHSNNFNFKENTQFSSNYVITVVQCSTSDEYLDEVNFIKID